MDLNESFRVLVVDDDELAVSVISNVLTSSGCTVTALATAIGITQVVLQNDIDVVVLDLHMPALRGDRLAAMLRGNKRLQNIPVVLVSAATDEELRAVCKPLQGVVALPKKRVASELPRLIQSLATKKRSFARPELVTGETPARIPIAKLEAGAGEEGAPVQVRREEASTLASSFLAALPGKLVEVTKLWRAAAQSDTVAHDALLLLLQQLTGECQLLEFVGFADVLAGVQRLAKGARSEVLPSASATLLGAVNALTRKAREGEGAKTADMRSVLQRLALEIERTSQSTKDEVPDKIGAQALGAA